MYNTVHSVCKLLTDPGEMATEERGTVEDAQKEQMFFVTRDSQNIDKTKPESRKLSYVGMRNLSDPDKIDEKDILSSRGTLRGIKNRVRAGLANFENPKALKKVSLRILNPRKAMGAVSSTASAQCSEGGRGSLLAKHDLVNAFRQNCLKRARCEFFQSTAIDSEHSVGSTVYL